MLIGNLITSVFMIPLTIILIRMGDKHAAGDGEKIHAGKLIVQNLLKAIRNPIVWIPISGSAEPCWRTASPYAQHAD